MSVQIAVRRTDGDIERLDAAVARGVFASGAAAVRAGLRRLLGEEREAQIVEAYRRGYAGHGPEDWVGEAGLRLGAEQLAQQDRAGDEPAA